LPSACVSQGRRFTIYSCPPGGILHAVTLDVDEIGAGAYTDAGGQITVPVPRPAELPDWVQATIRGRLPRERLEHGTVVVVEKLDRLTRTTVAGLERHLIEHCGLAYRNYLAGTDL